MKYTYTFSLLEVSKSTFNEIKKKLEEAGYDQAFGVTDMNDGKPYIDMRGISIVEEKIDTIDK